MPLASTNLVAEIQTWFSKFIVNSVVNKYEIPKPPEIPLIYFTLRTSFIELLFNDNYSRDEYFYRFESDTNKYAWPQPVKTRLLVYPRSAIYYKLLETNIDTTGTNVFELEQDDVTLLNALLQYRQDSTSLTIIDSTSTNFVSNILYAHYSTLNTNLSKMIFMYLNLKIYNNYSDYDSTTLVSSSTSVLESCYETYILDEFYSYISNRGV